MIKIIQKDTLEIAKSAVNRAVNLIKPTYGPSSNKVIISKVLNKMIVDDGVQIARDLELEDPLENAIWTEAKHTAIRTNDRVGDGTTGALIMLQAIMNEATKSLRVDGRKIEKELKKGVVEAKEQLLKMAHQIKTLPDLEKVARISFDDEPISKIIAGAWNTLGKDGVLTVGRSGTMDTFADLVDGIKIERGYVSPLMVTNEKQEGIIEKPHILLTDYRLTETNDVLTIMSELAKKNINTLVVICDNIEQQALSTVNINIFQGKFMCICINVPFQGAERSVFLNDLAVMTGAKVFSQEKGDKLELATIADLGRAERFISHKDRSVILGPKGKKEKISEMIASMNAAVKSAENEYEKNAAQTRLARITGKIGVIKVGASTTGEEKALQYKVDDAIHAVQSAFKGGVVAGGGMALAALETSSPILNAALKAPFRQLKENIGLEDHKPIGKDEAINVVTGEVGNFIKVGVMDPVDVLIAGVESAVSIASLLLTSSGMIVEPPKKPKEEE